MKDINGVEIEVGMTATHIGYGENKGRVGKVVAVSEDGPMAIACGQPVARVASPHFSENAGWSSWLMPQEIAVVPKGEQR